MITIRQQLKPAGMEERKPKVFRGKTSDRNLYVDVRVDHTKMVERYPQTRGVSENE